MFIKKIITLAFLFIFLPLFGFSSSDNYSIGSVPLWVKPTLLNKEKTEFKNLQGEIRILLFDTQENREENTRYYKSILKPLTIEGVELASKITIPFDPCFEKVKIHEIGVFREGVFLDKIRTSHHKIIQREERLESNLYSGSLSLLFFLNDIRKGDVLEYSYSIIRTNPPFGSHYYEKLTFDHPLPVEKISYRLLADKNRSFLIKNRCTDIEPTVFDLSSGLREWVWECNESIEKRRPNRYEPVWYNTHPSVEISEYLNWQQVVSEILPLYQLPENLKDTIPSEMRSLIQSWEERSNDKEKLAKLALEFVQDEIRYLGLEEGIKGYQPSDPIAVFERRFGDCKDKTFLLHAFLYLMNISSTPILVHSQIGKILPEGLCSPFAFNHLALQVNIGNATYFVDPTLSLQMGNLKTTFFPEYEFALLICKDSKDLIKLPKVTASKATEIDMFFTPYSEMGASLKIKMTFYDFKADYKRWSIAKKGPTSILKDQLDDLKSIYEEVFTQSPLEVLDNQEDNSLTLISSYLIPTETIEGRQTADVFSYILKYYLDSDFNRDRDSPYSLIYPLFIKESIHLENLHPKMALQNEELNYENEALSFSYFLKKGENSLDVYLKLKHLQDHVPKDILTSYWNTVQEIKQKVGNENASALNGKLLHPEKKRFSENESRQIARTFLEKLLDENRSDQLEETDFQDFFSEEKGPTLWRQAYANAFGKKLSNKDLLTEEEVLTVLIDLYALHNNKITDILLFLLNIKYPDLNQGGSKEYLLWKKSLELTTEPVNP